MTATRQATIALSGALPERFYCAECGSRVCGGVERIPGVVRSACDVEAGVLTVEYDPSLLDEAELGSHVRRLALDAAGVVAHAAYRVSGLD